MLYIIARFKVNKQWAYRLFDTDTEKAMDVAESNIIYVLQRGRAHIENADVHLGKLVGTMGDLERFTNDDRTSPIVLIAKIMTKDSRTIGYKAVNCKGQTKMLRVSDIIDIADKVGIQNAKIVERDGRKFISAIKGNFEKAQIPENRDSPLKAAGNYLYYINHDDGDTIYKKDIVNNIERQVCSDRCQEIVLVKDCWLVYISKEDNNIYKIREDGVGRAII